MVAGGRQMFRMAEGTNPDRLRFVGDSNWTNSSGDWQMSGLITALGGINATGTVSATTFTGDGSALTGIVGGGPSIGADSIIRTNAQTISENITIPTGTNGSSVGTITVANGYTVTVANNARWVII